MAIFISYRKQIVLQAVSRESAAQYIARQQSVVRAECAIVERREKREQPK